MFIFKGKNSNDMGVYVREENFLGKAPMRYDSIEIEGKHGADLVELGYQNFEGTLNDVVIMNDNFDEVLHWLSGTGELIYMGKKTRIHFLDAYQIAKHKKTFSVPFIREPFWYLLDDSYSTSSKNNGTTTSQPIIKLSKVTKTMCEYEVGEVYFKYHFNNDDHVIIDCEEMNATYEGLPRNRHLTIGFEFPVLKPGDNVVKQISGDAKIEFKRKDRWL